MDAKKKLKIIKAIMDASDITPTGRAIMLKPGKSWKEGLALEEEKNIFNYLEKESVVTIIKDPSHFKQWDNIFISDFEKSYYLLEKGKNFEKMKKEVMFKEDIYEL